MQYLWVLYGNLIFYVVLIKLPLVPEMTLCFTGGYAACAAADFSSRPSQTTFQICFLFGWA